jgi:hypothetical protein
MHHSSSVDYMGNVIVPVVTKEPSGFISAAIITDENGDGQATGALGCFASEEQARQFAVEYAKCCRVRMEVRSRGGRRVGKLRI